MRRQPRNIDEIPLDTGGFVNRYFYPVYGAAKIVLDNKSEILAFVGPKTEDGKLVYSNASSFSKTTYPSVRMIGSETDMIEISRIVEYIPIKGIL